MLKNMKDIMLSYTFNKWLVFGGILIGIFGIIFGCLLNLTIVGGAGCAMVFLSLLHFPTKAKV